MWLTANDGVWILMKAIQTPNRCVTGALEPKYPQQQTSWFNCVLFPRRSPTLFPVWCCCAALWELNLYESYSLLHLMWKKTKQMNCSLFCTFESEKHCKRKSAPCTNEMCGRVCDCVKVLSHASFLYLCFKGARPPCSSNSNNGPVLCLHIMQQRTFVTSIICLHFFSWM